MKSKIIYISRVAIALVLYVGCSSVVCCACKQHASSVSTAVQEEAMDVHYNPNKLIREHKDVDDVSPLSIGSIRLTELL